MADIVQLKENGEIKYLKTHVNAIEGLTEKLSDYNLKLSSGEELWKGMAFPKGDQKFTMSKSLDQCQNGYMVVWAPFINEQVVEDILVYQFINKSFKSTLNNVFTGHNYNRTVNFVKRLAIANDRKTIVGNNSNNAGENYNMMMRWVYSY